MHDEHGRPLGEGPASRAIRAQIRARRKISRALDARRGMPNRSREFPIRYVDYLSRAFNVLGPGGPFTGRETLDEARFITSGVALAIRKLRLVKGLPEPMADYVADALVLAERAQAIREEASA
jgi:hypothetical protein